MQISLSDVFFRVIWGPSEELLARLIGRKFLDFDGLTPALILLGVLSFGPERLLSLKNHSIPQIFDIVAIEESYYAADVIDVVCPRNVFTLLKKLKNDKKN